MNENELHRSRFVVVFLVYTSIETSDDGARYYQENIIKIRKCTVKKRNKREKERKKEKEKERKRENDRTAVAKPDDRLVIFVNLRDRKLGIGHFRGELRRTCNNRDNYVANY